MKQIEIKINPIGAFMIDPSEPEKMNRKYPFMHNFFVEKNIKYSPEARSLMIIGLSDHVDENLQNPVLYAGLLAKSILPHDDWRNIDSIHMISFVDEGVPDPSGSIQYVYKGKTIKYPGRSGKYYHSKKIDVSMTYIDRNLKPSAEADPYLCDFIQRMNEYEENYMQEHSYENWEKWEEEYEQQKLDFWKAFLPEEE